MTTKISPRDWEAISAYLDGQLSSKERVRLEDRLRSSTELRTALQEIRRTRAMLRSQPRLRAPRNFTLSPEMVGRQASAAAPVGRLFPAMRLASALASFLFVLVLLGDLLLIGPARTASQPPEEPAIAMQAPAPEGGEEVGIMVAPEMEEPAAGTGEEAPPTFSEGQMEQFGAETPTPEPGAAKRAMATEPTPAAGDTGAGEQDSAASSLAIEEGQPEEATSMAEASPQPEAELPEIDTLETPSEELLDAEDISTPETAAWTPLRIAEIGLAVIALITGLIAIFLRFFRRV